jgi:putative ABC transport system substrate-binding protein
MNPTTTTYNLSREEIENAGRVLQVKLVFATVSTDADLDPAFASLAGQRVGAILPEAEPFLGNRWQLLVPLAARHAIPMMQEWREAVAAGGLISYAPSLRWVHRQVGSYTGQILKWRQAIGFAGGGADQVRAGRQSQNRRGTGTDGPAMGPSPRR